MIIYKATNRINGKIYIGQAVNGLNRRKIQHASDTKKGSMYYFHRALRKYGIDNFIWQELCCCFDIDGLNEMEVYFIKLYDSFKNGYNLTEGGGGRLGYHHTEESNQKNRIAHLGEKNTNYGKPMSNEQKQKISEAQSGIKGYWYGKHLSDITKKRISRANLGKKVSDETRKKLNKALRLWAAENPDKVLRGTKHPMFGKKHSFDSIEKMSQAHLGKKMSDKTKEKLSELNSGANHPMFGTHPSKETRQKMRVAQQLRRRREVNGKY